VPRVSVKIAYTAYTACLVLAAAHPLQTLCNTSKLLYTRHCSCSHAAIATASASAVAAAAPHTCVSTKLILSLPNCLMLLAMRAHLQAAGVAATDPLQCLPPGPLKVIPGGGSGLSCEITCVQHGVGVSLLLASFPHVQRNSQFWCTARVHAQLPCTPHHEHILTAASKACSLEGTYSSACCLPLLHPPVCHTAVLPHCGADVSSIKQDHTAAELHTACAVGCCCAFLRLRVLAGLRC
jgi:hypothetical protein